MRNPDNLKIDRFVGADFAGLWGSENPQDPSCVKSRTGYVMCLGGCLIFCVSKLQQEIALSTMETKYVASSTAMRDWWPLQGLKHKTVNGLGLSEQTLLTIRTGLGR